MIIENTLTGKRYIVIDKYTYAGARRWILNEVDEQNNGMGNKICTMDAENQKKNIKVISL